MLLLKTLSGVYLEMKSITNSIWILSLGKTQDSLSDSVYNGTLSLYRRRRQQKQIKATTAKLECKSKSELATKEKATEQQLEKPAQR